MPSNSVKLCQQLQCAAYYKVKGTQQTNIPSCKYHCNNKFSNDHYYIIIYVFYRYLTLHQSTCGHSAVYTNCTVLITNMFFTELRRKQNYCIFIGLMVLFVCTWVEWFHVLSFTYSPITPRRGWNLVISVPYWRCVCCVLKIGKAKRQHPRRGLTKQLQIFTNAAFLRISGSYQIEMETSQKRSINNYFNKC